MKMLEIAILCSHDRHYSNYRLLDGLILFDRARDTNTFNLACPVIAHPPCAQWSRLRSFAHNIPAEKQLAFFCWDKVNENGGIFEHPSGSSFFKEVHVPRSALISIDQIRFCHPGRKRTWLFFSKCSPLPLPVGCKPKTQNICSLSSCPCFHSITLR